jgi:hypothetical protein
VANRIVVAGGGGGSSGGGWDGGGGGGNRGGDGDQSSTYARGAGGGGTQTTGGTGSGGTNGSAGNGGTGETRGGSVFGGGGGGGGYFGGGGGRASDHDQASGLDTGDSGGGGGSGFVESKATNVYMATGGTYGNGSVVFTWPQKSTTLASALNTPRDVAVDLKGNAFVARDGASVVRVTPNGATSNIGSGFDRPIDVAVDSAGNVYVADRGNQKIYKVAPPFNTPTNGTITTVYSGVGGGFGVDGNGNLYVACTGPYCTSIYKIAPGGNKTTVATGFRNPEDVAVNATCKSNCTVYVLDYISILGSVIHNLYRINPNGTVTLVGNIGFLDPTSVSVDASGTAYITSISSNQVARVPINGLPTALGSSWGNPTSAGVAGNCSSICAVFVTDASNSGSLIEVY